MSTLTFALLSNVGSATILALLAGVVCRWCFYRHRPALTHTLWLLVLAKLITPPLIPVPVLTVRPEPIVERDRLSPISANVAMQHSLPIGVDRVEPGPAIPAAARTDEFAANPGWSVLWFAILLGASACGTLILVTGSISQLVRLSRILRRATTGDQRLTGLAQAATARMGLREAPVVCAVDAPIIPFLWARFSGPFIVLPRHLVNHMSDEQVSCILCHEMAHYARRDHWANLFAFLVTSLFWWHPVAWLAKHKMRAAQEVCCDGLVLTAEAANRRCYAETLFQALEFIQSVKPLRPALTTGFGDSSTIKRRFEMIANLRVNPRASWYGVTFAIVCLAAMLCVPVRGQSRTEPGQTTPPAGFAQNNSSQPKQVGAAKVSWELWLGDQIGRLPGMTPSGSWEISDPTWVVQNKPQSGIETKEENDPVKLRKEIGELRAELAKVRLELAKAHYASAIQQAQAELAEAQAEQSRLKRQDNAPKAFSPDGPNVLPNNLAQPKVPDPTLPKPMPSPAGTGPIISPERRLY